MDEFNFHPPMNELMQNLLKLQALEFDKPAEPVPKPDAATANGAAVEPTREQQAVTLLTTLAAEAAEEENG